MSNNDIKVLNDVTKTLIDSRKGYETCCDVADDNHSLQAEFKRRCAERSTLVGEFQNKVRTLGGEPENDGSAAGAVHRGFTRFTSLFQDDQKAAISALDDGEEHLAESIESEMKDEVITAETRTLLAKALTSAREGERFADNLDD